MKKTVIAIFGSADNGKSSSIIEIANRITSYFKGASIQIIIPKSDIKALVILGNITIGIESEGDPGGRLRTSLADFVSANCDIIICATRTRGETVNLVNDMHNIHGYDIIWTSNYFSNEKNTKAINGIFTDHILFLVSQVINGNI